MSYRQRYRLTRTLLAAVSLAYIATVWPAGNEPPTEPARSTATAKDIATVYEDGSIVYRDGSTSCIPGAACDDGAWWPCWAADYACEEEG